MRFTLACEIEKSGPNPEVVLEATYGWYWAADVLQACGARVHLAHPLGVKGWNYRRVKNDELDAEDLCDLLRMGRLPEAWIAPPAVRELRELVRHRAKMVALRSGLKAQVHAVLAKEGVTVPMSDLFGKAGMALLAEAPVRSELIGTEALFTHRDIRPGKDRMVGRLFGKVNTPLRALTSGLTEHRFTAPAPAMSCSSPFALDNAPQGLDTAYRMVGRLLEAPCIDLLPREFAAFLGCQHSGTATVRPSVSPCVGNETEGEQCGAT